MASTAPITSEKATVKPSFAKVAASAYKPRLQQESLANAKALPAAPHQTSQSQNMKQPASTNGDAPDEHSQIVDGGDSDEKTRNTAARTGQWADTAGEQAVPPTETKDDGPEKPRSSIALVKFSAAEDSTTQLSSSDGSAKPPSIDGKSIASVTTFALDEKESLRPDDSASLRAVEEEDVTSPPDSVTADSRTGSESGAARAFQSQLREIAVMGPQPQRGVPPGRFPNSNGSGPHTLYDPNQPPNGMGRPMSHPMSNGIPPLSGPQNLPAIPDEKLIEALQSPRDRLFVVKIEQDFIDFIKDSRENELSLPNCNTFYRMLAHRLADYYLLGHVVDSTLTGVKITRTPYCRIPPPLSQMVDSTKSTNTPPVELPARKIMRRGDDNKSGTNTTANSENPSKATSEVGGSDGGDGNDAGSKEKDKTMLTREEREARYREARQRIFGSAESEENDLTEATGSGEEKEKDPSRSSSTTGKKKSKKQRNYDDDGFEARSRFNAYYPPQYPIPGYAGDNIVYYNGFPGQMPTPQFSSMNAAASPPAFSNGYPAMMPQDSQSQYGWPGQQYQSPPNGPMMYPNYGQMPSGYDLSPDFQRGMQSFQSAGMPSQATPKLANAPMAPYPDSYQQPQQMPMSSGWPQMGQQPSYNMPQAPYAPNGPGHRPMSAPLQGSMPGTYPYGQFPPAPYNGKPNRNQHPIPGSFNRQQFNPQSQAFVPGGRNMPFPMQPNLGQGPPPPMNGYSNFPIAGSNQVPNQMARPSPPIATTQSVPSPHNIQIQGGGSVAPLNSIPGPPQAIQTMPHQPGSAPPGPVVSNTSSVPSQSSIAKYGTPSHLPAKPPAPVQSQQPAPKFNISGHPFPPMARVPSNMSPGFVNSSPVSIRSGAGPSAPGNNNNPN